MTLNGNVQHHMSPSTKVTIHDETLERDIKDNLPTHHEPVNCSTHMEDLTAQKTVIGEA